MVPRLLPARQALQGHLSCLSHSHQRVYREEPRVREGRGDKKGGRRGEEANDGEGEEGGRDHYIP